MSSEWIPLAGGGLAPPPAVRRPDTAAWPGARERELPLGEADRRIRADIAALGWRARYRFLGSDGPEDPVAAQCELWGPDGTEVPYGLGSGKGRGPRPWSARSTRRSSTR
ncbi:hypothetical protein ACFQXA_21695 [Nocardiopsis composta]